MSKTIKTYIVCWTQETVSKKDSRIKRYVDNNEVFMDGDTSRENKKNAMRRYDEVVDAGAYTANVCEVIKSTDY